MSKEDNYSALEYRRLQRYRDAFDCDEARNWMLALSPSQREWAEKHGLLIPHLDTECNHLSLDCLPNHLYFCHVTEDLAESIMCAEEEAPDDECNESHLHDLRLDLLRSFLMIGGNPRLNWMCLSYLADRGGVLESYAKQLGMSKQAFHYHVRKLEKLLGVHSCRQRSENVRNVYRTTNKRKH